MMLLKTFLLYSIPELTSYSGMAVIAFEKEVLADLSRYPNAIEVCDMFFMNTLHVRFNYAE